MVIPGLIEMHCHILPGVDDGSKDTETSVKMLRRLALQGAETVVLTPPLLLGFYFFGGLYRPTERGFCQLAGCSASGCAPAAAGRRGVCKPLSDE